GISGAMYPIKNTPDLNRYLQELSPVARHMEKHFSESISMAEMAAMAGLSPTHFNRRFKTLLRMTPMHYLRSIRVQTAQQLLTTTTMSIADVAVAVGFNDQSHLTKRFKAVTGLTPSAYRKRFVRRSALS
ncbi:MAG: AraC family transcriptional regulator, partial [Planctomycetota bacterium]